MPTDFDLLLYRQDGVLTRAQSLRFFSAGAVRHFLTSGRWQAPHRGVYLAHSGPVTERQRQWIAVLACAAHSAGLSALHLFGLRGFATPQIHVLIGAGRRNFDPPEGVSVHRTASLPGRDRTLVDDLPCTSAARAAVDAAQWASSDERAAAIIAASYRQRLIRRTDIDSTLARMPRARRRGLVLDLVADLAGGATSLPEAQFLHICRRAGFPRPKVQVSRRDASGRRRYLDAYFEEYGVHVEVDGGQHTEAATWWADMKRQNDLWIAGDRILRFPSWAIRTRPDEVAAQVAAALRAAGWRS